MKIIYSNEKIKAICSDLKKATMFFGGNKKIAIMLLSRINALNNAETIKDICIQPQFHFHKLENKGKNKNLEGYFAIDVKSHSADKWRIILQPLDENEEPFVPCNIDEIATKVRIVLLREVSNHYE